MKTLLVFGEKTFRITVPDNSKITFGPWSPPKKGDMDVIRTNNDRGGTLRIYDDNKNVIACFAGVTGYRDVALEYSELVAKEEGATIWKSDQNGYERESKQSQKQEWVNSPVKLVTNGRRKKTKDEVF